MLARTIAGTVIRLGSHESRHVGMRRNAKARISGAAIVAAPVMPDSILCAWECHESFVQLVSIPRQSRWKKPSTTAPTPATNYCGEAPCPVLPNSNTTHSNCLKLLRQWGREHRSEKGGATGGVTGRVQARPQRQPGRQPQGLARATRELVGEDGMKLAELWWSIASDETRRRQRPTRSLEAPGRQGSGHGGGFQPQEGDPLDLAALEGAAESSGRRSFGWLAIPSRTGPLARTRHS